MNNELERFLTDTSTGKISFEQAIMEGIKLAKQTGYNEGFQDGVTTGYALAVSEMNPALSDGLRHGSSECGKAMKAKQDK